MSTVKVIETTKTNGRQRRRKSKKVSNKATRRGTSSTSTISSIVTVPKTMPMVPIASPSSQLLDTVDRNVESKIVKYSKKAKKNQFLLSVVLPHKAEPRGIPDGFSGGTTAFKVMFNNTIPVIGAGKSPTNFPDYSYAGRNNFPPGCAIVRGARTLYHPYAAITENLLTSPGGPNPMSQTGLVRRQSRTAGLYDQTGLNTVGDDESLVLPYNQTVNLVAPITVSNTTAMDHVVFPFKNVTNQGNIFYGHSVSLQAQQTGTAQGTITVQVWVNSPVPTPVAAGLNVSLVDATGTVISKDVGLAFGLTTITFLATELPANGNFLGDRMFGITMRTNTNANLVGDVVLEYVSLSINYNPSFSFKTLTWTPINFNDVDGAARLFTTYRVVGICHWLSYLGGNGFNDAGGRLAAGNSKGGRPITEDGTDNSSFFWTVPGLLSSNTSDSEPIEHGIYGFIPYKDVDSFKFHTPGSLAPYEDTQGIIIANVNAQSFNGVIPMNMFSLRGCIIYEATTNVPYIQSNGLVKKQWEINETDSFINSRMRTPYMSNATHEEVLEWAMLPAEAVAGTVQKLLPTAQMLMNVLLPFMM